jgi:hypothetical protein
LLSEPSVVAGNVRVVTPEDLRNEAAFAERMSRLVSFQPDKARLRTRAAQLRRQADRIEALSWRPTAPAADAGKTPRG